MPVIPQLKESQRISQGGVSPFQNSSDARTMGEHLQLLGKTVAAVADGLHREYKEDTYMRNLWADRARKSAELEAKTYMSEVQANASTEDDGSKLVDTYNERMATARTNFQKTVPTEFQGYTELAYDTTGKEKTADVLKERVKMNNTFKLAATAKRTDAIVNSLLVSPSNYEKARYDAVNAIGEATANGLLSEEQFNDNIKGIDKKLAEAQINGYLSNIKTSEDYNSYKLAQDALTYHSANGNISPEDAIKKTKSIEDAYWTGTGRIMNREEEAAKKLKEINEAKEQKTIDDIHLNIQKNLHNPEKVEMYKKQLMDKMSTMRYARDDGFKALKVAEDFQDNAMSYEISTRLGSNPSMKHIQDLKNQVMVHEYDGSMSPQKAEYWIKRLDDIKEKQKKDPNYAMNVQAIHAFIKTVSGVGPFEALTDFNGAQVKNANYMWLKASTLMGKHNMSPLDVMEVLKKDAGITKAITGLPGHFPIMGLTQRSVETFEDIEREKKALYDALDRNIISSGQLKDGMKFLKRVEDSLNARKTLIDKRIEHLGDDPFAPSVSPTIPLRR